MKPTSIKGTLTFDSRKLRFSAPGIMISELCGLVGRRTTGNQRVQWRESR